MSEEQADAVLAHEYLLKVLEEESLVVKNTVVNLIHLLMKF